METQVDEVLQILKGIPGLEVTKTLPRHVVVVAFSTKPISLRAIHAGVCRHLEKRGVVLVEPSKKELDVGLTRKAIGVRFIRGQETEQPITIWFRTPIHTDSERRRKRAKTVARRHMAQAGSSRGLVGKVTKKIVIPTLVRIPRIREFLLR